MSALDYESTPRTAREDPRLSKLLMLFLLASSLAFAFNWHWLHEPFGIFRWWDCMILVGLPIVVTGFWVAWFVLALRRPRVRWFVMLPILIWAALCSVTAVESISRYLFREPWH